MVWYESAPMSPDEDVKYLGEVLEWRGTPFREMDLGREERGYVAYSANTTIGQIGVAISKSECNVFFSPLGTRRFISLGDWKECFLGEEGVKDGALSTKESVEWVLGLLEEGHPPEVDLEKVEELGQKLDRQVMRDRRLVPLHTALMYLVFFAVLAWSVATNSIAGFVCAAATLPKMFQGTLEMFGLNFSKRKK